MSIPRVSTSKVILKEDGLYLNNVKIGTPSLKKGSKIYTKEGYKEIQVICLGDEVLKHLNRWKKVICIDNSVSSNIWKIKTRNGLKLYVTENQSFLATIVKGSSFGEGKFIKVKDLSIDSYLISLGNNEGNGMLDYEYDKIVKIENTDRVEQVFSLGVEEDNSYIVNDIIVKGIM